MKQIPCVFHMLVPAWIHHY